MGQTIGIQAFEVSDPKTQYEYSKNDMFLDENQLDDIEEYIQKELEADARHIETLLLRDYAVVFYGRDIVRVKLDPNKYKTSHGVLSRGLRIKCLIKYMKIPYTITTRPYDNGYETIINRVFNVENLNKHSVSE